MRTNIDEQAARVVSFHYTVWRDDGSEVDHSGDASPMLVLLGAGNVIAGVDRALAQMQVGEMRTVEIAAQDAYGPRDPALRQRVPRKTFAKVRDLKPGTQLQVRGPQGPQVVTVVKIGASVIDVDFNHPLAGVDLRFELRLVDERPATTEEIAHGHAHGPGGAQHG